MDIVLYSNLTNGYDQMLQKYLKSRGHRVNRFCIPPDNTLDMLKDADLGISYYYGSIFKERHIQSPKHGIINIHPSMLPYGRGAYPNVWAIIDNKPAGVTVHWIDDGIDTGPILYQQQVHYTLQDTGETLYRRLMDSSFGAFKSFWPGFELQLANGILPLGIPQDENTFAPTRIRKDVELVDNLMSGGLMEPRYVKALINVLRARTFSGHESAYIIDDDGNKVYVRVSLEPA